MRTRKNSLIMQIMRLKLDEGVILRGHKAEKGVGVLIKITRTEEDLFLIAMFGVAITRQSGSQRQVTRNNTASP